MEANICVEGPDMGFDQVKYGLENGTIGFWTRPRLRVLWTLRSPATSGSKGIMAQYPLIDKSNIPNKDNDNKRYD
ncbi:hypothetical protein RND71_023392 [Anisodus tanguticus]|uniref:Uncharacterized protein n=1 Tax=Anisodus tanguticus TaxID=243964 RepID=A0AAE1RVG0_9SOLA|nr:hypothetical protein RND71_023392 [Anisodus tanguticus]